MSQNACQTLPGAEPIVFYSAYRCRPRMYASVQNFTMSLVYFNYSFFIYKKEDVFGFIPQ
jgi:hypothetical protein